MNSRMPQKCLDLLWPRHRPCSGCTSRILLRSPGLSYQNSPRGYATANNSAIPNEGYTLKPPVKGPSPKVTNNASSSPKFVAKGSPTLSAKSVKGATSNQLRTPLQPTQGTQTRTPLPSSTTHPASLQAPGIKKPNESIEEHKLSAVSKEIFPNSTSHQGKMRRTGEKVKQKRHESDTDREKRINEMTEEEQIKQIDRILNMSKLLPTLDPWGQGVDTLDVQIPYSVSLASRRNYASWRDMFDQFVQNRQNDAKNAASMYSLAQGNGFPGINLAESTLREKVFQWPWRAFQCQSLKANAWITPFRAIALETYKNLNSAVARRDDKTVKRLAIHAHQDTSLRRLKKFNDPSLTYIWRFHREVRPTRVISIRASEAYLAPEEPKFGNRLLVHALVRFDTEQSLEIYDKRGNAVHASASDVPSCQSSKSGSVAAERKRVTEYLVMEKRMWYDGPWTFREQLWDIPGKAEVSV